jgi:hypothetical protein
MLCAVVDGCRLLFLTVWVRRDGFVVSELDRQRARQPPHPSQSIKLETTDEPFVWMKEVGETTLPASGRFLHTAGLESLVSWVRMRLCRHMKHSSRNEQPSHPGGEQHDNNSRLDITCCEEQVISPSSASPYTLVLFYIYLASTHLL